jgi:hypothetical protein
METSVEPLEQTTLQNPANSTEEPEVPAAPPEKLTRKQLGQLRRQYLTITHGTVKACGHLARFSKDHDPKNNCVDCWSAYFATSVDLEFIHTVLTTKGVKALVAMKGTKFTKMFHGFLASQLLPALAAEIDNTPATEEAPAQIVGGTFGTDQSSEVSPVGTTEQAIG